VFSYSKKTLVKFKEFKIYKANRFNGKIDVIFRTFAREITRFGRKFTESPATAYFSGNLYAFFSVFIGFGE
jgi:hypothetical protein